MINASTDAHCLYVKDHSTIKPQGRRMPLFYPQSAISVPGQTPSLAFVMIGAIATFATFNVLVHRRSSAINGAPLPGRRSDTGVSPRLWVGAAIFGAGWGLSGVCPGPALADVASLQIEVFAYLGAMLVGMVIAQRGFGADAPKQKEIAFDSFESAPPSSASK